ncbi:MAG TPA: zinc ribbon domain-containing protein [Phycisphaerae bacterium]|nr:zinc ribbon domain-containing protein [Phycisphaerae bacterium]
MPTYEYRCSKCGHEFEEFQSITAKPIRKCPKCGRMAVDRLISAGAGVIFRGSGFYQTDYRSEKYKEAAKKETPAAPATSAAGETAKTDAKPGTESPKAAVAKETSTSKTDKKSGSEKK